MEGHLRNSSHVHAGRGQDAAGADASSESLVECNLSYHGAWAYHTGDAD
jgi:hypothetical protein